MPRTRAQQPAERKDEQLINIESVSQNQKQLITLKDILSTRKLREPQLSPDGRSVAFIIQQGFLEKNENRSAIYLVNSDGGSSQVKVLEEKGLSQLQWQPDSKFLTYLSSKSNSSQIWRIKPDDGISEQLTQHTTGVSQYRWSPNGQKIAFLTSVSPSAREIERIGERGAIYDGSGIYGITTKFWIKRTQQLWIYDIQKLTTLKIGDEKIFGITISELNWSPDGERIAVSGARSLNSKDTYPVNQNIGIVSLRDGKYVELVTWGGLNRNVIWSPDGNSIAFLSNGGLRGKRITYALSVFVVETNSQRTEPKDVPPPAKRTALNIRGWSKDGKKIYLEMRSERPESRTLHEVFYKGGSIRPVIQTEDNLSEFSINFERGQAACIRQNSTTPPEVTAYNFSTGLLKNLTELNPEYKNIRLADAAVLNLTNKYGKKFHSFFLKPLAYVAGKRYPMVVILYRFSGQFLTDFLGNYPIQSFAANGHAVLLINIPEVEGEYTAGNYKESSLNEAYNPQACVVEGVETIVSMGIADPSKIGIMGWSYGSFLTDFIITHTPNLFAAASSGDSSLYSPNTYWITFEGGRKSYDNVLGGPPFDSTHSNWKDMSPPLNAARVRVPLLMEYIDSNPGGLEFYTSLKKQGKQVELVIYPNESHVFAQPKHRFYSMQRNLDWFNFWLQDREDPNPNKAEQYKRWRDLKKLQEKNHESSTSPAK